MFRLPRLGLSPSLRRLPVLPEATSVIIPKDGSFDDVAREALLAAEEVIREGDSWLLRILLLPR